MEKSDHQNQINSLQLFNRSFYTIILLGCFVYYYYYYYFDDASEGRCKGLGGEKQWGLYFFIFQNFFRERNREVRT